VAAKLVGSWVLTKESAAKLPSECHNLRLEFTPDMKLIAVSGDLRFVTKISIKLRDSGFAMHQEIVEHNNKQNCQGKSADYIVSHFGHNTYWEWNDGLLRQYTSANKTAHFFEFVRLG
jgi:hypothetical protein